MSWLRTLLLAYAAFLAFSGIQGYVGKQSVASLMGGVGAAVVVLVAVAIAKSRPAIGHFLAFVVAIGMIGRFLPAFLKKDNPSEAIWPELTLTVVSALVAAALVLGHFLSQKTASGASAGASGEAPR